MSGRRTRLIFCEPGADMLSALLMLRRFGVAMGYAFRETSAGSSGRPRCSCSSGRDVHARTGLERRRRVLRRGRDADDVVRPRPKLAVTEPWLRIFTSLYVLVGIGILVEVARRLGMGFIASRNELAAEKAAKKTPEAD